MDADQSRSTFVVTWPLLVSAKGTSSVLQAVLHASTCVLRSWQWSTLRGFNSRAAAVEWLQAFGTELSWVHCQFCLRESIASTEPGAQSNSLRHLLEAARNEPPNTRIQYRDRIAAHGRAAIDAVKAWFSDPQLAGFAIRIVVAAAPLANDEALVALSIASQVAIGVAAADARAALVNLRVGGPAWPRLPIGARAVYIAGDGPWSCAELRSRLPYPAMDRSDTPDEFVDTVIVGLTAKVDNRLLALVDQRPRPARFVPQEAWIALLLFDRDWWLDDAERFNEFVDKHPPLAAIRATWPSGFCWPGVESSGLGAGGPDNLSDQSVLMDLGYSTGVGRSERWSILSSLAVPSLGLEYVAVFIAGLVKLRKLQGGGRVRYAHAIREWEWDLARLKADFFRPGASPFPWPGIGP